MPRAAARNLIATASITIDARKSEVWAALVSPEAIKQYMFGTEVASTWKVGSPITWTGEWEGRSYQDSGVIRRCEPEHTLAYTHFSPLSGLPDSPENHHLVTIELSDDRHGTEVTLTQDNNASQEALEHSRRNWASMLEALKKFVEKHGAS
jgi:uncharacterized protein YndB with AHSA1/START domain